MTVRSVRAKFPPAESPIEELWFRTQEVRCQRHSNQMRGMSKGKRRTCDDNVACWYGNVWCSRWRVNEIKIYKWYDQLRGRNTSRQ